MHGYFHRPEYRPLLDTNERNALYEELRLKSSAELRAQLEALSGEDAPGLPKQVMIAEIITLRLKS